MKPATILSIYEIKSQLYALEGQPVRTWGRIKSMDIGNSMVSLEYSRECLEVSTELIPSFDGRIGDVIQMIGDINEGKILMKSFQNTPEMDVKLFEQVLLKRRKFLEEESIR